MSKLREIFFLFVQLYHGWTNRLLQPDIQRLVSLLWRDYHSGSKEFEWYKRELDRYIVYMIKEEVFSIKKADFDRWLDYIRAEGIYLPSWFGWGELCQVLVIRKRSHMVQIHIGNWRGTVLVSRDAKCKATHLTLGSTHQAKYSLYQKEIVQLHNLAVTKNRSRQQKHEASKVVASKTSKHHWLSWRRS